MNKTVLVWGSWVILLLFLVSYGGYELFFVGYMGMDSCSLLAWLGLWLLVLVILVIIAGMVEVLRERR